MNECVVVDCNVVSCECIYWARDGQQKDFTVHHPKCEKYDPNEIIELPKVKKEINGAS